jgi:hypothetical protein
MTPDTAAPLARARGRGLAPYRLAHHPEDGVLECISAPFPEGSRVYIMARRPNDPATMRRYPAASLHALPYTGR